MWKISKRLFRGAVLAVLSLAVVSCGTKRAALDSTTSATKQTKSVGDAMADKADFMRKVKANEVDAQSITAKIKFTLRDGVKDMSVGGSLRMKKDEVIRIQLTPFGLMEVGRIEFTKDYVLLMDRMNKEYIKAGYADVGFLQKNGLDFYALQALFWNKLFMPGKAEVTDKALDSFGVTTDNPAGNNTISLKYGDLDYQWSADRTTGQIKSVDVTYGNSRPDATSVTCTYGSFEKLGTKKFPTDITLMLRSNALKKGTNISVNLSAGKLDTDSDWETFTSVSGKYRQVDVEDVIKRLLKL